LLTGIFIFLEKSMGIVKRIKGIQKARSARPKSDSVKPVKGRARIKRGRTVKGGAVRASSVVRKVKAGRKARSAKSKSGGVRKRGARKSGYK
jgi:hypothetical protein